MGIYAPKYKGFTAPYGLSQKLWADVDITTLVNNPAAGIFFLDDFVDTSISATAGAARWKSTQATAGTAVPLAGTGGLLELDSGSTTADQGIQVQLGGSSFIASANTKLYFETRVKVIDTIDKCQFFAGLSEVDTSLFASGENSSANHIGFEMGATTLAAVGGKLQFYGEKAGTRGTVASVKTLAEDTWTTIGFRVNGVTSIDIFVDGEDFGTQLLTANIPIVNMTPSLLCQSEGTNDPIVTSDWVACAQVGRA